MWNPVSIKEAGAPRDVRKGKDSSLLKKPKQDLYFSATYININNYSAN